jgi:hypothetical protein
MRFHLIEQKSRAGNMMQIRYCTVHRYIMATTHIVRRFAERPERTTTYGSKPPVHASKRLCWRGKKKKKGHQDMSVG